MQGRGGGGGERELSVQRRSLRQEERRSSAAFDVHVLREVTRPTGSGRGEPTSVFDRVRVEEFVGIVGVVCCFLNQ